MADTTSEAISENISKKKRGRPKAIDELIMAHLDSFGCLGGGFSRRHHLNSAYQWRALNAIDDGDVECKWLWDGERIRRGETDGKRTILYELGRIEDPGLLLAVAKEISKHKMLTKDAVAYVRRVRPGRDESNHRLSIAAVPLVAGLGDPSFQGTAQRGIDEDRAEPGQR